MIANDQSNKGGAVTNTTNIDAPVHVEVTINAKTDASPEAIGAAVSGQVREEIQKTFQSYLPKEIQ
ncbi:hypothetical protein [Pseudomonas palleroniana]